MNPSSLPPRGADPRSGGGPLVFVPSKRRRVYRYTVYTSIHYVWTAVRVYPGVVPKLWNETIEAHRREVGDAILDTTAALVSKHGLRAVTMSQIAQQTGIG